MGGKSRRHLNDTSHVDIGRKLVRSLGRAGVVAAPKPAGPLVPFIMPAARLFGRAWRFASDDLPIPAAIGAIARAIWIGAFAAIWILYRTPDTILCTAAVCSQALIWNGQVGIAPSSYVLAFPPLLGLVDRILVLFTTQPAFRREQHTNPFAPHRRCPANPMVHTAHTRRAVWMATSTVCWHSAPQ